MALIISNLKAHISCDEAELKQIAAKSLNVSQVELHNLRIVRQSLDARKKQDIHFLYTLEVALDPKIEQALIDRSVAGVTRPEPLYRPEVKPGSVPLTAPIIVAGMGPAGLFAAYLLSKYGYKPVVIERGKPMHERTGDVAEFRRRGNLNPNSNVLFGEGGAGTFSDGKLTTRIKDPRAALVLETLVAFGAPKETLYMAKPHIGTDLLSVVITNLRNEIMRLGGQIRFERRLTGIGHREGRLEYVSIEDRLGNTENLACSALILAIGHSARDTVRMLLQSELEIVPKPFAVGVRIEHPRELIDKAQYGAFAGHPRLSAAEYRLSGRSGERGVYTFCMCPGGEVIASASDAGQVVTNGMSLHARNGINSNSAVVVQVDARDFGADALAGVRFQESLEHAAYKAGGGDFFAPAQTVGSFLGGGPMGFDSVRPTYLPGVKQADLKQLLPGFVSAALADGIKAFGRQLKGFDFPEAVLTAVESRTSSPFRIMRDEAGEATRIKGIYPAGEGSGYAGGIVSAAVDGLKAAERLIAKYKGF